MPGDILCFCPASPSVKQHAIIVAQSALGYQAEDACFTHVALYAGNGHVYDSTPKKGVRHRLFANAALPAAHVRVRRIKGMTPQMQFDICDIADHQCGKYAWPGAVWHFMAAVFLSWLPARWKNALQMLTALPGSVNPGDPLYCGQLVELAILLGTGKTVIDATVNNLAPLPAAFSTSPDYDEVPITW